MLPYCSTKARTFDSNTSQTLWSLWASLKNDIAVTDKPEHRLFVVAVLNCYDRQKNIRGDQRPLKNVRHRKAKRKRKLKDNKMKKLILVDILILISLLTLTSCTNNNNENSNANQSPNQTTQSSPELSADFLGNYHGVQPSYYTKNQYGDDMIVNGKTITVPSSDFKFLIKENNVVTLQQTNLEDNNRVYYSGNYEIISDSSTTINIACKITDGKNSNPKYILNINKIDKSGTCIGHNEPDFNFIKIK